MAATVLRFSVLAEVRLWVHDTAMVFLYHTVALRIVGRSAVIWLGLRFAAAFLGWGLNTSLPLAIYIVLLTTGLGVFDARRRSRYLLLENLGVRTLPISLLAACLPVVLESVWLLVSGI